MKCTNQEVEKYLYLFTNTRQDNWVLYLLTTEFVLNSWLYSAYCMAPFGVIYGYCPNFMVSCGPYTKFPVLKMRLTKLWEAQKKAEVALHIEKCALKVAFKVNSSSTLTFILS
jgi:hypothetical protein